MKQQISLDDLSRAEVNEQPGRTAFIKEWGDFGFDFGQEGTSKFYIVCAVIVANSAIPQLEKSLEKIGFTEEEQLRVKVLNELLPLDFNLIFLIADKGRFFQDVPVTNFKGAFVKHLCDQLYKNLYHAYPKLQIAEEQAGLSEFQAGFKDYVRRERPVQNLFDQYDFDFVAGRQGRPAQLAAWLSETVGRQLLGENAGDYLNVLYWKILNIEKIPGDNAVNLNPAADNSRFNQEIANLAFRKARGYIREHERDGELEKRLQVSFLKYLIFEAQYGNPYKFITSKQILSVLSKYADIRISKDFLYRKIVAPLRDARVVLASSPQGYKLPVSVEDISAYLQQTNSIIAPMLHRMGLCREVILQQTGGRLDVLAEDEFLKYQKYFD